MDVPGWNLNTISTCIGWLRLLTLERYYEKIIFVKGILLSIFHSQYLDTFYYSTNQPKVNHKLNSETSLSEI